MVHTRIRSVGKFSAVPYTQNMHVEWKIVTGNPQVTRILKEFAKMRCTCNTSPKFALWTSVTTSHITCACNMQTKLVGLAHLHGTHTYENKEYLLTNALSVYAHRGLVHGRDGETAPQMVVCGAGTKLDITSKGG